MKNKIAIIFLSSLILLISCDKPEKEVIEKKIIPPTPVEGIIIVKSSLSKVIKSSGLASGINEAYVVSETQGKIISVNFKLGQYVKSGQTLVQVQNTIQKRALEQAEKQKETTEINLNITQKLFDEGNASKMELTSAENQFKGASAAYEQAKKQLNDTYISAPISGYIAQKELTIQKGNILSGGTLVTRIVNIQKIKVQFDLGEMEVGIVKKGLPVEFIVPAISDSSFKGQITAVAAGSNPANGSYAVEAVFTNNKSRSVKSGMTIKATIYTDVLDSGFIIPSKSIIRKNEKDALFISVENKAQLKFVTTGRRVDTKTIIEEGLQAGMEVITSGVTNLSTGDTVIVTSSDNTGE